jgi:hypothetical protein
MPDLPSADVSETEFRISIVLDTNQHEDDATELRAQSDCILFLKVKLIRLQQQ